jgi:rSAM/selenodomain-associated transferase 1
MAKPVIPGRVKTRLMGRYGPKIAARVYEVMLRCMLSRIELYYCANIPSELFLAVDTSVGGLSVLSRGIGVEVSRGWKIIDQGTGDLGQRMARVWASIGKGPVFFFGVDSPDIPGGFFRAMPSAMLNADLVLGPAYDGGYWTFAAQKHCPGLFRGIDWGTSSVYYQTMNSAKEAGLSVNNMPVWHDVDRPGDVVCLRRRLQGASEAALVRLREGLDSVLRGVI